MVISPLQDFLTSMQSIFLLRLWVQDSSVSYKITASWGSWPVQTPAAGGDAVCLAHTRLVCAHGTQTENNRWGKKTFINIPVPREGVAAGDVLKPTVQTFQLDAVERLELETVRCFPDSPVCGDVDTL